MNYPEYFGKDRRFVVIRPLDSGGMGTVFLARDTVLVGRVVAIKMPHPHLIPLPESPIRRRFGQEVAAHNGISHPNVVPLYDFGFETVDGLSVPYMVLEFVKGIEVNDCCETSAAGGFGPLPAEVAGPILLGIVSALRAMHEAGIIHRDIKSKNVMVGWDKDTVKVLDFGIARNVDGTDPGLPRETQVAQRMGTLGFMSPEQMADARNVDHRTDIYAAGAVLYQMMTAVAEVPDLSRLELSSDEFLALPEPWRQIAYGATRCKPGDRAYQTAREMVTAVRAAMSTATGPTEPFERWLREQQAASPIEKAIRQAFGHGRTIVPSDDDIDELSPFLVEALPPVSPVLVGSKHTFVHDDDRDDGPNDNPSASVPKATGRTALKAIAFVAAVLLAVVGTRYVDGARSSVTETADPVVTQTVPFLPTPSVGSQGFAETATPQSLNATTELPTPSVGSSQPASTSKPKRVVDPVPTTVAMTTPSPSPSDRTVIRADLNEGGGTQPVVPVATTPDTGSVHLVKGAIAISLVGADGASHSAGRLAAGAYQIRATFRASSDPVNAGSITVFPGQDLSVTCSEPMSLCNAR